MKSEIRKIQVDITKPQYPRFRSVFPPYFIKKAIPKELLDKVIKKSIENSKCFARANFLPEASWIKVGRTPIDDYNDYKLILTYSE